MREEEERPFELRELLFFALDFRAEPPFAPARLRLAVVFAAFAVVRAVLAADFAPFAAERARLLALEPVLRLRDELLRADDEDEEDERRFDDERERRRPPPLRSAAGTSSRAVLFASLGMSLSR